MPNLQKAILRLTCLYSLILVLLALACSVWLYNTASNQATFLSDTLVTSPNAAAVSISALQYSQEHTLRALIFFNLFIFGAGFIASYALAKRTLKPVQASYELQATFTADASHELRTPLTALKSELQLIKTKKHASGNDYHSAIESSLSEVERLETLTERLLQLAEPEARSQPGLSDVEQSIKEVHKIIAPALKHKHLHFQTDLRPAHIAMHPTDLVEVLTIVIQNAVKYSSPYTTIAITGGVAHGKYEIKISDQGPGISPEDLPYVFERFYRGKNATKQGFGLGLAVAKKIVTNAGGSISIESSTNGTTCILKIPTAISG